MEQYFTLKLDNGAPATAKADSAMEVKLNEMYVFRRDYYTDMGEVTRKLESCPSTPNNTEPAELLRPAEGADFASANENEARGRMAMDTAGKLVESLGLEMKLLNAHFTLDGKLVTIQFSADGRVDFRELVKELSRALSTRIELRQIGVRDETGIYGGIAVCGQQLCCSRFLKEFNSINVRMAKEQDLSLTPATISGVCGRLKCCLKFEHEGYQQLERGMPRRGEWCDTPQGHGRICDRNLLTQTVLVMLETGGMVNFNRSEITVVKTPLRPAGNPAGATAGKNGGPGQGGKGGMGSRPRPGRGGEARRDGEKSFAGKQQPQQPGGSAPAAAPQNGNGGDAEK